MQADLARIGIPMHLDHGDGRDTHPGGMGADVSEKNLILCRDRPEQERVGPDATDPYDENEPAVVQHAAHALTAAVASALTGFGHHVRPDTPHHTPTPDR
ncbi:hypothetical protein [Kitasatospora sp. NPDC008115]|uniref:hypothetical protein n=1 Tax=Kitasatospora sp. NPDC008115 TaxID=3364022 RepID=UPI0036E7E370